MKMKYFFYFFYFINFSFILSWIILPGDSSRTNCHKLCGENGYNCYSEVFGSFSCREAAINYCNNPYIKDQMLYDPSKVYCFHGGGCFVNCAESTFLELHRINGTCSTNICDVGEFSYSIMCPCIERPTEPPHYVITMTTTEEVGTFSFLTISSFFVVWLLCCCCSIELMKKSSNRDIATDDELEYFVEKEIDPTTQCLWMLWCEPCKKGCWYGFQETKRYIYRCCCKPKPKPHLLSDSSIRRNRRNKNLNTNNQNIVSQSTSQSLQSSQSYFSWFYSLIGISSNSNNSNYDAVESELSNMENSELHDAPDQKKRISLGQLYGSHSSRLYSGDISEIDKSLSNNFTINTQSYDTLPKAENEEDISQHQKTKKVFLGELYGSQSSKLYGEKSSQSEKNPSSENYSTNSSRLSNHTANPIYSSHLSQNSPLQNTLNQPQLSSSSLLYLNKNNLQGSTKDSLLGTNRIINSTFNSNTTMGASTSSLPSSSPSSTTTTTISPLPLLSSISTSRVGNNLEGREIERNTGIESIEIVKPKKISLGEMYSSQSSKYYGNQSYSSKSSSSP